MRTPPGWSIDLEERVDALGPALEPEDYPWAQATDDPLRDDEIFILTFAAQVEWATEGTFRSLDVTRDDTIRRFLRVWLVQERVHAVLLRQFLSMHGVAVVARHRTPRQRLAATRGKWLNACATRMLGRRFTAVHMAWGAINELSTLRMYSIIRERTDNELLRVLLADIIRQEVAHFDFYRRAASELLGESTMTQRLVRTILDRCWDLVGSGLQPPAELTRLVRELERMEPGIATRLDATIDRLPGLTGMALVAGAVRAHAQDDPPSDEPVAAASAATA